MAGKRQATSQLHQDNWDNEEESEEAGTFKQADESTLKGRVFKKAKRRGITSSTDDADKPSLFTGFKGFAMPKAQDASFSFNKKVDDSIKTTSSTIFPSLAPSNGVPKVTPSNGALGVSSLEKADAAAESTVETTKLEESPKFLASLKSLNTSVVKWLSEHLEKNAFCYFTPVFKDYEKHLEGLKAKYKVVDTDNAKDSAVATVTPAPAVVSANKPSVAPTVPPATTPFSTSLPLANSPIATATTTTTKSVIGMTFGTPSNKSTSSTVTNSPAPTFSFGSTQKLSSNSAVTAETKPAIFTGFGAKSTADTAPKPLFSFGTSKPDPANEEPKSGVESKETTATSASTSIASSSLFSFGGKPLAAGSGTGSIFGPSSSTTSGLPFGMKQAPTFSFGAKSTETSKEESAPAPTFGFTFKSSNKPSDESNNDKPAPVLGFSFKPSVPTTNANGDKPAAAPSVGFSFKAAIASASAAGTGNTASASGNTEDEEYVPPKPEVEKSITEDDAVYTKRVKLFYEKNGSYIDKGIGNLFIKSLDGGKHSLLIRADTNLGNILLNIALADSIPVERMGKNNVTIICIANPPMEAKAKDTTTPTMLLVRVKTAEDADELCAKIKEYKKQPE